MNDGGPGRTKVIYLARRNPRLTREEFAERWRQHSLLAGSMPSIRPGFDQVAQCLNIYDRTTVARASLEYDGINLLTLVDQSFATAMWQSDEVQELILPDELQTFDTYVRHFSLITRETIVNAGGMSPICLIVFLKRDQRLSMADFVEALCARHSEMAHGRGRAVVNTVIDRPPGYNFDAVTELWFSDDPAAAQFLQSRTYADTYLAARAEIADEWRTLTMWTRINYARPPLDSAVHSGTQSGAG